MARWSGVGEPDDPLRADDALVGSGHEDVLSGSAAVDDAEPGVPYADPAPAADDEVLTSVAPMDDQPTMEMPAVVVASQPEPRGRFGMVAPWVVFAAVAVVVLAATSTLASVLQGPRSERQSFTGLLQVPTSTASAPAPAEAPPPTSAPAAEPTPEPEKKPAARPTQRQKATRAPAPPPRAGAVSAPTTSAKKKPGQTPSPTAGAGSAAAGKTGDTAGGAAKDEAAKDAAKGGAAKGGKAEDGATASGDDSGDSEDEED